MHPQFKAHPRSPQVWTTPLAHLLPAGIASLVGILLFAQMMASKPASGPAVTAGATPTVSWRVPVESGVLATVMREERVAMPKPVAQMQKTVAEAPSSPMRMATVKPAHLRPGQDARHEAPVGPPLELAAWQRPDPAPVRPRADLTGVRSDTGSSSLVQPVERVIATAQKLPEKVGTWIGDAAEWVGGGLSSVLPLVSSRDGLRASL